LDNSQELISDLNPGFVGIFNQFGWALTPPSFCNPEHCREDSQVGECGLHGRTPNKEGSMCCDWLLGLGGIVVSLHDLNNEFSVPA
jgi:hypothetical protein